MNKMNCKIQKLDAPIQVKTCNRKQYPSYKSKNLTIESVVNPDNRSESIDHGSIYYLEDCEDKKIIEFDSALKVLINSEANLGVIMYYNGDASFCEVDPTEKDRIVNNIYARGKWRLLDNSYKFTITEYLTKNQE